MVEFREHQVRRRQDRARRARTVFLVYFVAVSLALFLLLGFGRFFDATFALVYQETTVLAFPAAMGAVAAEG